MSLAAGGHRIRVLAALFAASALAGCTTLGPDFHAPAAPAVGGYLSPGEAASREVALKLGSEAAADWWTAFHSAELDALVRQAYAGNPSLAAAKASLVRARELARSEAGRALPAVDSSASAQRERLNFTTFGLTFPGFPTNADFSLYSVGAHAGLFPSARRLASNTDASVTFALTPLRIAMMLIRKGRPAPCPTRRRAKSIGRRP